jgi:membrane carboxypeptidase/penicillin-binding protein PbpC
MDVKTEFPSGRAEPYAPVNYDGKFRGPVQLRFALGSSINVPAVKVLAMVGLKNMLSLAYQMGFTTLEPTQETIKRVGLSVTLGGGEVRLLDMAVAYGAFSNGGRKVEPVAILRVTDRNGNVLYEHKQVEGSRVLSEQEAFLINHILSDNNARLITFGENSYINIAGHCVAVKTGTTDDQRDNWTVGWTTDTVVGVWVGNNDNSPMKQVASGVTGAAPIWRRIFMTVLRQRPDKAFSVPSGVEAHLVDEVSGWPAHDDFSSRSEYFIAGTLPTGEDPIHAKLKVCKFDGRLATEVDIAKGDYEEKEYFVFKEDDPLTGGGQNMWQKGIDEWLAGQEDERYHPPTDYCDVNQDVVVRITQPGDKSKLDNNTFEVKMEAFAPDDIDWVKLYVDGDEVKKLTGKPFKTEINLDDGAYTLRAKARDEGGREGWSDEVRIGVKKDWDYEEPTPSPTPTATP